MASALESFMKQNVKAAFGGPIGLLFGAAALKDVTTAENKFKAILKVMKDLVLVRVAMVGTFSAISTAIRALVKDTGSLDAALKRLGEVQRYQRMFTPFIGSIQGARKHVADLLNFAAKTPFRFESVAEADKILQGLTRGAFAGTGALKTIGDAAAKSGNGIEAAAEAVGSFYEMLKSGGPIKASTDQLRMMGLISEQSATSLDRLSESGASSTDMANNLTRALNESRGGMKSFADDLESVAAARDKATESAKAGFGKAFTESEVENTKNYTKAIVAISPALEKTGGMLAAFSNGLSTTTSWITKVAAESGLLGGAIKVLGTLVVAGTVALTAYGAMALPGLIGATAAATAGMGALGAAITAIVGATGIGLALIAITGITVGIIKLISVSEKERRELQQLEQAHRKVQASINAHAAGIETLTDLHEAYGKSISNIIDLQNQLVEAQGKGDVGKVKEILRAIDEAKKKMAELPTGETLASPARMAVIRGRTEESIATEESRFHEALRAQPGRAPELRRERAGVLEGYAAQGRTGLEARMRVEQEQEPLRKQRAELETSRALAVKREEEAGKGPEREMAAKRRKTIDDQMAIIDGELTKTARKYGQETSVGLQAKAQQIEYAKRAEQLEAEGNRREASRFRRMAGGETGGADAGQRIQDLQARAQLLSQREAQAPQLAQQARDEKSAAIEEERGRKITEIQNTAAREEVQYRLAGATKEAQKFHDIGSFATKFEQYRQQFDEDTARKMALQDVQTDLMGQATQDLIQAQKPIADSLTRVGGGGGVGGPSGDPMVRAQERMADLTVNSNRILQEIASNTAKSGTAEPGGGAAQQVPISPGVTPTETQAPAMPTSGAGSSFGPETLPTSQGGVAIPSPLPEPVPAGPFAGENAPKSVRISDLGPMAVSTQAAMGVPMPMPAPTPSAELLSAVNQLNRTNQEQLQHLTTISDNSGMGAR